ncbi:hypothetical protein [Streptantibioticus cattleyicolor]|uniref:Uncharacterized protein n=1 Tax=Streptantibioticus cattleyicolor (strain ATCC 35852 / DSM 46488 / JCM 4925 / NBRC 14057 / NRRL 8057) TaxID=1003195 RepID=F8JNK6_STREN|nr:hypothetical protein [Streptantibioticus cattleyicolor]AEW99026.1 hypothetical protein SCATT_p08330 [Streptantibioticus cattleyicolor NRRL 8057 = DSM 46488]CCB71926.1 protein of unknown function [Streptantibioticus cattleyicolor NRRL 8057 = DSM 46488]
MVGSRIGTPSPADQAVRDDTYHLPDNNLLWAMENPRLANVGPTPTGAAGKLLLTRVLPRRTTVLTAINCGAANVARSNRCRRCPRHDSRRSGPPQRITPADAATHLVTGGTGSTRYGIS